MNMKLIQSAIERLKATRNNSELTSTQEIALAKELSKREALKECYVLAQRMCQDYGEEICAALNDGKVYREEEWGVRTGLYAHHLKQCTEIMLELLKTV